MTIEEFAKEIEKQEKITLVRLKLDCEANWNNAKTHIHIGRKWTRLDVGSSGRYMINAQGQIYGIKAYGVPHLGHYYGTLEKPENLGNEWGKYSSMVNA
ncbi:hypothetical protein M0R04_08330 [Candidatus Dojkabacteria bacterium]|jgi:hypothetical protein|nr:hypothetical protein [Candidatus Dojkabacteria bacterium]